MEKQETVQKLQDSFAEILKSVDGIDERAATAVFLGTWSVKDILAHLGGWHHQMTTAMERMARGEKPTPEGVDFSDADGWNARFAAAMKPQSTFTVIADLKQSFANYARAAQAIPADRYGEGKTINRLLEGSGYGHYTEHLPEIQQFLAKGAAFDPGP